MTWSVDLGNALIVLENELGWEDFHLVQVHLETFGKWVLLAVQGTLKM